MDTSAYLALVLFLVALVSSVHGLRCYECNVECRNSTQGCVGKADSNFINDTESNSTRISCDNAAEVDNCVSCMKIRTGYRRYEYHGEFVESEKISKVCQKTESRYSKDTCEERGPGWSLDIVCYCYSDYCNSAQKLCTLTIPILALLLHALL